jgi:hypothetical protein
MRLVSPLVWTDEEIAAYWRGERPEPPPITPAVDPPAVDADERTDFREALHALWRFVVRRELQIAAGRKSAEKRSNPPWRQLAVEQIAVALKKNPTISSRALAAKLRREWPKSAPKLPASREYVERVVREVRPKI